MREHVQVKLGTSDFRDSTYSLSWLNMTKKSKKRSRRTPQNHGVASGKKDY